MPLTRDITVVGASAGGIHVVRRIIGALPPHYRAALFVVVHLAPDSPSMLHELFDRAGPLPAVRARDGLPIVPGRIVVAPPDHHLILEAEGMRVTRGPRENRHRPSIDVLFRSAAVAFGARVTGVVLSGLLDDGAVGLWAIKRRGGIAIVQDPNDAEFPDMPINALKIVEPDHTLPANQIAPRIVALANEAVEPTVDDVPLALKLETRMAYDRETTMDELDRIGKREPLTCPECGGALWEIEAGTRYRCHVGHAYSGQSLAADQDARVEAALWAALRTLEENERLADRLARSAAECGGSRSQVFHEESARGSASMRGCCERCSPHPDLAQPTKGASAVRGERVRCETPSSHSGGGMRRAVLSLKRAQCAWTIRQWPSPPCTRPRRVATRALQ